MVEETFMCHLLEVIHAFFNHDEVSKTKCVNHFSLFFVAFYSNRELLRRLPGTVVSPLFNKQGRGFLNQQVGPFKFLRFH